MEEFIQKHTEDFDNVERIVDEKDRKVIEMSNNFKEVKN